MSLLNLEGAYENELATTGEFNPQAPRTALMLPSGQRIVLPTEMLLGLASHGAALPLLPTALTGDPATRDHAQPAAPVTPQGNSDETTIPLVAEEIHVAKTEVETGRVRLRRATEEHTERVSMPLAEVRWEVEHVPIERVVDTQPEIRQVGETMIFPLVEERLVVRRELWLREEVHVHKVRHVVEKSAEFPLKRDVLVETRVEADENTHAG